MAYNEQGSLIGKQAQIFVTETCNYNCDGCPYPKLSQERQADLHNQELNPVQWKTITDYLYTEGIRLF
jgi:organic radical activating enzyme